MDWIKKKKEEAKQAAAKLQNKRAAFKGEGNVLGGGADGGEAAPAAPAAERPSGSGIKARSSGMPSFGKSAPPALTPEEQQRRREQQAKALEQRTNAWEKRVDKARKARLLQGEENEARLGVPLPPPPPVSTGSNANLPPPVVLSNDEVKAREIRDAHAQMGFNPYAATFSSSSEATSAMNSIGGGSEPSPPPPAAPSATAAAFPAPGQVAEQLGALTVEESEGTGAVYVLLRQEPTRAITAAETLIKLLSNIVKNPQDEKFRRVRLSNAAIQSKLVSVNGAVDILREAGFCDSVLEGEPYLILADLEVARVQSAVDRTEVALIQLQHDSSGV